MKPLFLDEYETGLDDLVPVVTKQVKEQGKQLFVRADKSVSYGIVMSVMDRLRGAGITDVGLVTTSAFDAGDEGAQEPSVQPAAGPSADPTAGSSAGQAGAVAPQLPLPERGA